MLVSAAALRISKPSFSVAPSPLGVLITKSIFLVLTVSVTSGVPSLILCAILILDVIPSDFINSAVPCVA